jgi:hypothetical protein
LAAKIAEWLSDGEQVPTVAEYRKRALALTDLAELKALFEEATSHRMAGAPTIDADGTPTVLGDLIMSHARSLKAAVTA